MVAAAAAVAASTSAGCARDSYMTLDRQDKGLVVVLPGIEGRGVLNEVICDGLGIGGVDWGIRLEDWTAPLGPLYNLRAEWHNRQKAARIAIRLSEYKSAHPDSPLILVGQSGGGAMALWIAECMPEGQDVDGIILIAPAISPGYMVDFALGRTRRGVINIYSSLDWAFLGVGTSLAGTMDGEHTTSAGRVGFQVPAAKDSPNVYQKLFQIPWQPEMAAAGNLGGHLSSGALPFVANYVAPMVLAKEWNRQTLGAILARHKPAEAGQPTGRPAPAPAGVAPRSGTAPRPSPTAPPAGRTGTTPAPAPPPATPVPMPIPAKVVDQP
jgi:pimeloyl-ACP methyl ester carboxylesterase